MVEFIEFYKLLGASYFVFYDYNMGEDFKRVLDHYIHRKELTLLRYLRA